VKRVLALLFAACGGGQIDGGDGLAFDIDLVDSCPVADPFYFGLESIEVQLRGADGGSPCIAARRCVSIANDDVWDPEFVEAALRNVAQPLLATDRGATDFKILGSIQPGCDFSDDAVFLCGTASLSAISGAVLEVPVDCAPDATDLPACPVEPLPDCE
jgi:hypothetical protein